VFMTKSLPRRRLVGGLALSAVLAAAGCNSAVDQASSSTASTGAVSEGGTVTVAQTTDAQPESFLSPALGNIISQYAVFETLTLIDTKTGQPKGVIAESWTVSPDGLAMELKLRQGATFHTGRQLTSEDVIFTIKQVQNPATAANTRFIAEQITNLRANGDLGLTLTFKRPLPNVFDLFEIMPIVDKETYPDYKAGKVVVGTGRFTWKSWTPGGKIVLEKYAKHRDATNTHLDSIEIQIIKDPTALVSAVRSGRVQYASGLPALDANSLGGQPGYAIVESGGAALPLAFDVTKPPFDKKAVRQAVQFAIDRARIVTQVHGGKAVATALPWRAGTAGYDAKQGTTYSYQPDKAKQMIADAGAAGATFNVVVPNIPESVAVFEIVQNNLAAVGLTAKSEVIATSDYDKRIAQRNLGAPAFLMRNSNALSPASAVVSRPEFLAENNVSHFTSPQYTKLVDAVSTTVAAADAQKALADFNAYYLEEAFALPVVIRPGLSVRTTAFDGIVPTIQGYLDLSTAYLVKK
jgi:peptide/nickel transport system substrate-binding protein